MRETATVLGWSAETWTALGTVITAAVAVVAAAVGYRQLRLARQAREDQIRPFVVVDIVPSPVWGNILNLTVENVGLTLATEVQILFTPELETTQTQYKLGESVLITRGIPSLPPRRKITALFDLSHDRKKADLPMTYDVEVRYSDGYGNEQPPLHYAIDMGFLFGLTHVTEYGLHHAAKALQEIDKTLGKWTGSRNRLNVWIRDEDEHLQAEWEEMLQMREEAERRRRAENAEGEGEDDEHEPR